MTSPHRQLQRLLENGDLLGERYRIGERVGAGAYGMIFRARDEKTGRNVAVKAIPPSARERSETAVGRFQREMKVIRSLNHPNIISLLDWGRTDEAMIYMILEFIDGDTLDGVVRDNPMDLDIALDTTRQLVQALEAAHREGVIHRDLKPANVMLADKDERRYLVKVLDFGMAKLLEPLDDDSIVDLTSEGMAVGTPRYIAPEQARGHEVGPHTDLYAVGLLLYEMLTGLQAVQAATVQDAVAAHVSKKRLELEAIDMVPPIVRPLLCKLVEKKARRRYQSASEVLSLLDQLMNQSLQLGPQSSGAEFGPKMSDGSGDFTGGGGLAASGRHGDDGRRYSEGGEKGLKLELQACGEELELDYRDHSPGEYRHGGAHERKMVLPRGDREKRRKRALRDRWFRPPRQPSEWAEGVLSVILVPLAFVTVGAQAAPLEYMPRLLLSMTAPAVALIWAGTRRSGEWSRTLGRTGWICCLAAIGLSLAFGPDEVMTELLRSPAWFLRPLEAIPAVELLEAFVVWLSRQWAQLLGAVFSQ